MDKLLVSMTSLLKGYIEDFGGKVEFAESITLVGRYGDRAATKYLYLKDGKLYAHVYNCWMENEAACLDEAMLSEDSLRRLIGIMQQFVD